MWLTFVGTVIDVGLSYQCDKVEVKVDGAPKCPRCNDRVYFNEEKKALGKTWHKRCFTCSKLSSLFPLPNSNILPTAMSDSTYFSSPSSISFQNVKRNPEIRISGFRNEIWFYTFDKRNSNLFISNLSWVKEII